MTSAKSHSIFFPSQFKPLNHSKKKKATSSATQQNISCFSFHLLEWSNHAYTNPFLSIKLCSSPNFLTIASSAHGPVLEYFFGLLCLCCLKDVRLLCRRFSSKIFFLCLKGSETLIAKAASCSRQIVAKSTVRWKSGGVLERSDSFPGAFVCSLFMSFDMFIGILFLGRGYAFRFAISAVFFVARSRSIKWQFLRTLRDPCILKAFDV